jgi:hypothetical protein
MMKAANTLIRNAFSLRDRLLIRIDQADRKQQPRTVVSIDVFRPDDKRAVRMEVMK